MGAELYFEYFFTYPGILDWTQLGFEEITSFKEFAQSYTASKSGKTILHYACGARK